MMKCTSGPKHKWTWQKDVTNVSLTMTERGTIRRMSRRGVYVGGCGAKKYGEARSGL